MVFSGEIVSRWAFSRLV